MAADVGRQMKSEEKPGSGNPITRDFLGGCFGIESKELDLDLHVPNGWEKRLDLQTGKVYIQRCISQSQTLDHNNTNLINQTAPSSSKFRTQTVNHHVGTAPPNLELNLFSKLPSKPLTIHRNAPYQSVCTLDKVKSALARAWKAPSSPTTSSSKKRALSPSNSDASMISITNNNEDSNPDSPSRDQNRNEKDESDENGMLVAGACPCCLLYVLICTTKPMCPKCNSVIPLPTSSKKPKIDLNM